MFIITGGGSGIGKALALALAKRGKTVLIIGRRFSLLQETASASPLIHYFCADIASHEGRQSLKTHVKEITQIEGLVNNAGTIAPMVSLKEMPLEEWHQTLNINLDAPLFLPQILYEQLTNGRVLNIGSGAAYFATEGWAAYCVSKAALAMLSQCWQLESKSPAFASVKPGVVDTTMQESVRTGTNMDPAQVEFYKNLQKKQRLISPETVAEFLTWLLLDIEVNRFVSQEWDIYDTSHHADWLKPPHQVLHWES